MALLCKCCNSYRCNTFDLLFYLSKWDSLHLKLRDRKLLIRKCLVTFEYSCQLWDFTYDRWVYCYYNRRYCDRGSDRYLHIGIHGLLLPEIALSLFKVSSKPNGSHSLDRLRLLWPPTFGTLDPNLGW